MADIVWSDTYLVEVPELDTQHKALAELLNQFSISVASGNKELLMSFVKRIHAYASLHFQYEEQLMQVYGVSGVVQHADEHRVIIEGLMRQLRKALGGELTFDKMMSMTSQWFYNHINNHDRDVAKAINMARQQDIAQLKEALQVSKA